MRANAIPLAITFLTASTLSGQTAAAPNVTQSLHFNYISTQQGMTSMPIVIRTIADVPTIDVDASAATLSMSGPADRIAMGAWLFSELDKPAPATQTAVEYEYRVPASSDDVTKVLYLATIKSQQDLTQLVTAMRTIADVNRLFPFSFSTTQAIVMRGPADRVAMAEWLWHELDQAGDPNKGATGHQFQMTDGSGEVARVFYAAHINSAQGLTQAVTALRTIVDVNRMFPFLADAAVVLRSSADRVAMAEWLFRQLDQPADGPPPVNQGPDQYRMPGEADSVAKVFFLAHTASGQGLVDLTAAIRNTAQIQRIFPVSSPAAVAVRGTAAQIALAGQLIQDRDRAAR